MISRHDIRAIVHNNTFPFSRFARKETIENWICPTELSRLKFPAEKRNVKINVQASIDLS